MMNKQFVSGVLFTVGMAVFGNSMYELGRERGKRDEAKRWIGLANILESLKKHKEEEES